MTDKKTDRKREERESYLKQHAERRAAVVRHYGESQNMQATADEFGISRQRVEQILRKEQAKEADTMGNSA